MLQVWKMFLPLTKVGMPERSYGAIDYGRSGRPNGCLVIKQSRVNRGVDKKSICRHNLIEYNIPYTQL